MDFICGHPGWASGPMLCSNCQRVAERATLELKWREGEFSVVETTEGRLVLKSAQNWRMKPIIWVPGLRRSENGEGGFADSNRPAYLPTLELERHSNPSPIPLWFVLEKLTIEERAQGQ